MSNDPTLASTLIPLMGLVASIGVAAWVGELITRKTRRRAIGWPIGILLFVVLLAFSGWATSAERSAKTRRDFQKANPCPATGKPQGSCPGYIIDHIIPLCSNGPDNPSNMQWQTVADAKAKDLVEVRKCRAKKGRDG